MVVLIHEKLRIFSYNPFKKVVRELLHLDKQNSFPHYMNNLEGFNLRVSVFEQWPRIVKTREGWNGEDVTLFHILAKILNATITIVQTPKEEGYVGGYNSLLNNQSDFCFVKFFLIQEFDEVEFTTALELNSVDLFVPSPRPIPTYLTIFMVFTGGQWIVIGVLLVLFTAAFKWFGRYSRSIKKLQLGEVLMMMFLITLNLSVNNLGKIPKMLRLLLYPYIIISLIMSVAFQSHLLTRLQFMFFYDGIKDLKDLAMSGFPIYTYVPLPFSPDVLSNRVTSLNSLDYPKLTDNGRKLVAFGLPFSKRRLPPKVPGKRPFRLYTIDQALAYGYGVYMFRKHSPFVTKISAVIASIKQYALTSSRVVDNTRIADDNSLDDFEKVYLTLWEMISVFYIYGFGMILAILIFFVELYWKY